MGGPPPWTGPTSALTVETPLGPISIVAGVRDVKRVFVGLATEVSSGDRDSRALAEKTARELEQYIEGKRKGFTMDVDFSSFTHFQKAVLMECQKIPYGATRTYAEIARKVTGSPSAARAVGCALRVNRVPVLVPCHRVVRSDGALGDYVAGKEWKRFFLCIEKGIDAWRSAILAEDEAEL
jgi:methylated-DNA-[protein]-cysteine S-methyltransferase